MILSAHQPAYLPWLGYFDKIARSDVFIYLDTVQFEKNSFINRNQIKTSQGPMWLTIPVKTKGHTNSSLLTTEIDDNQKWRTKHLKSIESNYRKTSNFTTFFPKIETLINLPESNLADYCFANLKFWCKELGINTKIVRSSTLPTFGSKSDLVLDLCKHFDADHYLSGALGRNYLNEADFDKVGINIEYQHFNSPIYPQLWGEFIPNLAVLDWRMNCSVLTNSF
jgi:hypothetical protein